jgi:endonuclease/exonuclease/phosphatase family metal-dependent hydrolase
MKKYIRFILLIFYTILIVVALYFILIIGWGTISDYRPDDISDLEIQGSTKAISLSDSIFTFLTWNVGYCGLGAEMDFFYDGGESVRPTPEQIKKYTTGVIQLLQSLDSIDFIFLQEVDKNSARTKGQDETEMIRNAMPLFASSFGINYNVQFVPLPFFNPLGKVKMGQMVLSKYQPSESQRYSYHSAYAWPKRLFMLDRCFILSRFKLLNGKDLVVLNTHNSAYDSGGKLREMEMPLIRDLMLKEYEKGNYVVAGGDWNQNPPLFRKDELVGSYPGEDRVIMNASMVPDNWQIVYDSDHPTNRDVGSPLTPGETKVTIIDFFILSPNVEAEEIKVLSQNFQNSDHEPVYMRIKVKALE